jgi:predicted small lipoprotein YifL
VRATRTLLVVTAALSLGLTACGSNDPDVVVPPGDGLQQPEESEESEE